MALHLPRPRTVLAIARRDVSQELRGRRGWILPAITAVLLLGVASAPTGGFGQGRSTWVITGQVPPEVRALDSVRVVPGRAPIAMQHVDEGAWSGLLVRARYVPDEIREALDGSEPTVVAEDVQRRLALPRRSALLALIAASVLTGAISESIAGERSRKTLEALLSAAVTRTEIVTGKWLAWATYGGLAAIAAALVSVLLGRAEPGWWLLPLPTVAMGMVALGMYLVRRAQDVVSGATVSLRVLPAVLSLLGLGAWFVGQDQPLLGAMVPLGGALVATGDTWPGAAAPIVATASTLIGTGVLLWLTGRDLERYVQPMAMGLLRARVAAATAAAAMCVWWVPILGPLLWAPAGNANLAETLARRPGLVAGSLGLLAITAWWAARAKDPADALGLKVPPLQSALLAAVAGLGLAVTTSMSGLIPLAADPLWARARLRLEDGLDPVWAGLLVSALVIVAQELVYRGWLQRAVGPVLATLVFTLVHSPLDPLRGLAIGGCLAALTVAARGSVLPTIGARVLLALAASLSLPLAPWMAAVNAAGVLAVLALSAWIASRPARIARAGPRDRR